MNNFFNKFKLNAEKEEFAHKISAQIYAALKAQYHALKNAIIQPSLILGDSSGTKQTFLVWLSLSKNLPRQEKRKFEDWLKVRLHLIRLYLFFNKTNYY